MTCLQYLCDCLQRQHEIELKVHPKLPQLKDKSAAGGLLWAKRQLHYQSLLFDNTLQIPHKFPSSKAAVSEFATQGSLEMLELSILVSLTCFIFVTFRSMPRTKRCTASTMASLCATSFRHPSKPHRKLALSWSTCARLILPTNKILLTGVLPSSRMTKPSISALTSPKKTKTIGSIVLSTMTVVIRTLALGTPRVLLPPSPQQETRRPLNV